MRSIRKTGQGGLWNFCALAANANTVRVLDADQYKGQPLLLNDHPGPSEYCIVEFQSGRVYRDYE
jgi:hypothetical protein